MIAFLPFFPLAGLVWLLALPIIRLLAPPAGMAGLCVGWIIAGLSGASSFGLLALSNRKSVRVLLRTVVGGFMTRILLAAVGILVTLRLGYGPGWFCLSFFALYWLFFGLEFLAIQQGRRPVTLPEVAR